MNPRILSILAAATMLFVTVPSLADKFEAVHSINFEDGSRAKAAIDELMKDPAMQGAKMTLYARDFGEGPSHLVVQDFGSYAEYMDSTAKRLASPGWTRYLLETNVEAHYLGSKLVMVVDDHGPQHQVHSLRRDAKLPETISSLVSSRSVPLGA